jgi:hypothetical protein
MVGIAAFTAWQLLLLIDVTPLMEWRVLFMNRLLVKKKITAYRSW